MRKREKDETELQKRTGRITITAAVVSVILLVGGSLIYLLLQNILNNTTDTRIRTAADEYRNNIWRLVDSDIQILETFGSFLEEEDVTDERELAERLYEANRNNDFLGMAFFGPDASILTEDEKGIWTGADFETLPEEMREAMEDAAEGEAAVSDIYDSKDMEEDVFVVCVPVMMDGQLRGILAAADSASRMRSLFGEDGGNDYSYVHLIGDDGLYRIRSADGKLPEEVTSVYGNPHLTGEVKESMKAAMEKGDSVMYTVRVKGEIYRVFLEPVGMNGWYLFCVNSMREVVGTAYWIITGTQAAFLLILVFLILMVLSGYRMLRNNNRRLLKTAYEDPLTGGCNLPGFLKRLEEVCAREAAFQKENSFCVAALNIHQFKFINEIFGKMQADRLLQQIGQAVRKELAEDEFFGRETGDRFYLFLRQTDQEAVKERIRRVIGESRMAPALQGSSYHVLFYCGVADTEGQERNGELPSRMMTQVMFALDKAGETRQDDVWFYDTQLHEKEKRENYIESHMHQALENGEFRLFLQPKVNLRDGSLAGAEALVRWVTDEGKMMFPNDFIPLFERNGFCVRLDMYMVEAVCRHIHRWMEAGINPVPISVNQSRLLFYEADYPDRLRELVAKYDIPAGLVTLEILEGLAVGNVEELNERILLLQKEGFRISMDDFGTGYSSLNVMGALKIDELKLDRAFLMEISRENNSRQRAVMEMVMVLTRRLQISTVAEGVETEENEELIRELGCDMGQGYYYSRPISAEDFDRRFMNFIPPASDR